VSVRTVKISKKLNTQDGGGRHLEQEGQHPLTGQRAANFRLLTNQ